MNAYNSPCTYTEDIEADDRLNPHLDALCLLHRGGEIILATGRAWFRQVEEQGHITGLDRAASIRMIASCATALGEHTTQIDQILDDLEVT